MLNQIKELHTITIKDTLVNSLSILNDGRIAACISDNKIYIYNNTTFENELILTGHSFIVRVLYTMANGQLLSGSADKTIRLWTIQKNTYNNDWTFQGHKDYINSVIELTDNRIASGSMDKTIKIWSSNPPYTLITTLKGHKMKVTGLYQIIIKNKPILISGTFIGRDLIIWNLSTYQIETIINDIDCFTYNSILQINEHILLVGGTNTIYILNLPSYKVIQSFQLKGSKRITSFTFIDENTILFGEERGNLCLYNISSNTVEMKQSNHKFLISSLMKYEGNKFITGSYDGTITIWKLSK